MKRFLFASFVLVLTTTTGCKKFLDTKITRNASPANFYQNATQLQTALNSVYKTITRTSTMYGPFGSCIPLQFGATNDESMMTGGPYTLFTTFQYDASNANEQPWIGMYGGLLQDNTLLANIDEPGIDIDDATRDKIKGQALFLRGYFYYWLTMLYGDVPLVLEPTTSVNGDLGIARTPVKEVYAQILKDMTEAEALLGKVGFTTKSIGYAEPVTVDAVWGFLAKVCLTMASPGASGTPIDASKYNDAVTWANKLINSPDHALNPDYKQVFTNLLQDKYDVRESVWEAGFLGSVANGWDNNTFVFYCTINRSPGGAQGNATLITKKLYDSYADWDSVRFKWNCANFEYKAAPTNTSQTELNPATTNLTIFTNPWTMYPGKWRRIYEPTWVGNGGSGQTAYNSCNFPLLRMGDVYLMKAEAENEAKGPTQEAYDAINAIRRRAFKVPVNAANATCDLVPGLSKEQFRDSLKKERMRELCFEGLRKWDLVRWGDLVKEMQGILTLAQTSGAPAVVKETATRVSAKHFLLPIPTKDIQINSKLTQNPGW